MAPYPFFFVMSLVTSVPNLKSVYKSALFCQIQTQIRPAIRVEKCAIFKSRAPIKIES